ncbi:hypothetical protein GIB67_010063 [Kingdonia uniflora]|uniref:amino-acid N-acetyltransferase n=1 Tax=Kingdonia uniflora TaxID=39325 RepID=A0A7J7KVC7_9MAGN|nr:hypothetical protein GIB67_010063 [Kingdonia uniflora]
MAVLSWKPWIPLQNPGKFSGKIRTQSRSFCSRFSHYLRGTSGRLKAFPFSLEKGLPLKCSFLGETETSCEDTYLVKEQQQFVGNIREAQPYIRAHRGSIFVVIISGEIVASSYFDAILEDLAHLHGWGIRFIIVPGTHVQIDKLLAERGKKAKYVGQYRITDSDSLEAAMEAAGRTRIVIEAKLSRESSISDIRRHGENSRWHDVGVTVASGNYLAAKRRGVVDGVDYGATGEVKKIDVARMRERLDGNCIVILSNLGYSSSGEVLNCNTYEVATACALAIGAEKLICVVDGPILDETGRLIRFMSLHDVDLLIRKRAEQSEIAANYVKAVGEDNVGCIEYINPNRATSSFQTKAGFNKSYNVTFQNGVGFDSGNGLGSGEQGFAIGGEEQLSRLNGYLSELAAAAFVCRGGVQRVHLLDATISGVLLLELLRRDGMGTMVASDFYEGTRMAADRDIPGIKQLIEPLEYSGTLVARTNEQLLKDLDSFIVVERDGSIIACVALFPFFEEKFGEVAAMAVSPECRGHGQGDKLLDYVEKKAASLGLEKLFLLTTRTADWFERRGFSECTIESIPETKRKKINLSRKSKYYSKMLRPDMTGVVALLGADLSSNGGLYFSDIETPSMKMKKGIHPQMHWISYVTQSGRLINVMMTKVHHVGKVYHFRARRQMAKSLGQIAKFNRRYGITNEADEAKKK